MSNIKHSDLKDTVKFKHFATQSLHCFATMSDKSKLVAQQELISLAETAYQAQGPAAFAYPKSSAAAHEAGHVIEYAATGHVVRSSKILANR